MHDTASAPSENPSLLGNLLHHLTHMPRWHGHVLMLAAVVACVGLVGHVRQWMGTPSDAPAPSSHHASAFTAPRSGFAPSEETSRTNATVNRQPWYLSPQFLSIGGSVLGGFLIGWMARTFVKTITLLAIAGAAVLGGLSYFHVINVDLSAANLQYASAMTWLMDQASRLKDVAIAHLPVHAGAIFGAFLGFRRK